PAPPWEHADARPGTGDASGPGRGRLQCFLPAVPAEASARRDHAVARDVGPPAAAHDVADGACGARATGQPGDVAVGGNASGWDSPHDEQHARRKIGRTAVT